MLELDSVSTQAGTFRLEDARLTVAEGESHVLLGPSGSGKTTLLEAIIGLRPLTGGRVLLEGHDLAKVAVERRRMGYLPQRLGLFPHLTAQQNIQYGPRALHLDPAEYQPVIDGLVEATGITHLLDRTPDTLSGGEQQRVALARALAARTPILLLDEPFAALNESLRQEMWKLLKTLQARHGFAVLMITHDLTEAFYMGDRISVLIDGRIHQTGTKDEVWRHPGTLAVADYLGIHNIFAGTVSRVDAAAVLVDCPSLGGSLLVPLVSEGTLPTAGESVHVGIRAEYVVFRDVEYPPRDDEFVLRGKVTTVLVTGRVATLQFQPFGSDLTLELSVGRRLLRRIGLDIDQTATVALPHRDLLLLQS